MLDYRLQTFLTLCETGNYTRTAEILNLTQPAVSQHIKFLEDYYQAALIAKKGKSFALTEAGRALQDYARTLSANSQRIFSLLDRIKNRVKGLNFGATLTIGEYMLPPILSRIIAADPETEISMYVENTHVLQKMLWDGQIDFALLEGHFNRSQFESKLIANEAFTAVCSPANKLAAQSSAIEDLLDQTLILREPGSGTRDILEQALYHHNLTVHDFKHRIVVGNMTAIKELCRQNMGITFMYREAVRKELSQGTLTEISLEDFQISHPFNFVYLKNFPDQAHIEYWFDQIIKLRESI